MKRTVRKILAAALAAAMALSLAACGGGGGSSSGGTGSSGSGSGSGSGSSAGTSSSASSGSSSSGSSSGGSSSASGEEYTVGICNYVDDASLNQIVANIESQLETLGSENGVTFKVETQNPNGDSAVMNQIISDYLSEGVDLMVGIATPVAMAMQAATEDSQIPVVFSAVSDPTGADTALVESMEAPGGNITGTSDYLDTGAIMDLIFAADPDADSIGLLYDLGQSSSTTAIAEAKEYLDSKGVAYKEYNGNTVDEIRLAVDSLVADGVDAVFTPSDNSIMTAELSIYETLIEAGIPHYGGADSFALNGAFCGYGVDYANLGKETANMIASILVDGADPATTPVKTFENGIATVNTETCEGLGLNFEEIKTAFEPLCSQLKEITTAEEFEG